MENCLLEGVRICSFDCENEYGIKDHETIRRWKASQYNNQLIYEECDHPVDFRAGSIISPYFAHRKGDTTRRNVSRWSPFRAGSRHLSFIQKIDNLKVLGER